MGSAYVHVIDIVVATLSEPTAEVRERMAQLAASGPPTETVGLEFFGALLTLESMSIGDDRALTTADILLWVALPYVAIAVFVTGTLWRYRYDKFGWTTRSSQIYEGRLMRVASPLFHIGILAVLGTSSACSSRSSGPTAGDQRAHVPPHGGRDGLRRRGADAVRHRYADLSAPDQRAGARRDDPQRQDDVRVPDGGDPARAADHACRVRCHRGDGYNYRETVSPGFRSIFLLQPPAPADGTGTAVVPRHAVADCVYSSSGRSPDLYTRSATPGWLPVPSLRRLPVTWGTRRGKCRSLPRLGTRRKLSPTGLPLPSFERR